MDYKKEYRDKLTDAAGAIHYIPKNGNLAIGMAVSEPPQLLQALVTKVQTAHISELEELHLYYMHAGQVARNTVLNIQQMDSIRLHPFFIGPHERALLAREIVDNKKYIHYTPAHFSQVPAIMKMVGIDACIVMVSPMDQSGLFSCGTNCDYTIPIARVAKTLVVEVNPNMPRVYGDSCLHISEIDAIVESHAFLPIVSYPAISDLDIKISRHVLPLIPDHATLQFGIGSVPNAICDSLHQHHGLGLHTELISDGVVRLLQSGAVTNKYKQINQYKNVYTFAQGSQSVYEFLHENATMEIYPVSYVNNPVVISQNDNMVSINSFLQIDLTGQVNAEGFGHKQYSAPGGQLDFVRGAQLSKNGRSILVAHATAQEAAISRIVSKLTGPVTVPRTDVQYVVTEFGVANLKGASIQERVLKLIQIAHPRFQQMLYQQAQELKYIV